MKPRVLIVGTVPYNKKSTSRAFETYFHNWEKECLAQVFSNTKTPVKGHCKTLFQITDQRMLKALFGSKTDTGKIYNYDDLPDEWKDNSLEVNSTLVSKLYKIGRRKIPIIYLLRKLVWKKKNWCTEKFNKWLDDFKPECIFLSFSDDFFISEIALYAAERYNIPIISSVGDDYYFNTKFSLSPFYYIYKNKYRKLTDKVFRHPGNAIYIGDKIRDKYNSYFHISGETIYLTSNIERREFKKINTENPVITYFGNIRGGRNHSLDDIGYALGKINDNYILNIYSNEPDSKYYGIYKINKNICFKGSIPYSDVKSEMLKSDMTVIVEGFSKDDIYKTRYSLSTKAADSLSSGTAIFVYGSSECGLIEYMISTNAAEVCTKKSDLETSLKHLMENGDIQEKYYKTAIDVTEKNHTIENNSHMFEQLVINTVKGDTKKCP